MTTSIKTLLHGMTGPLDGKTYPAGVMMPLGTNDDQWIAAIASYVRNSFGNRASFITPDEVTRVRAATNARKTMWTPEELESSVPQLLLAQPSWKLTASHNSSAAAGALTFTTWNSREPQQPGMWFQVELSEPARLTEIQFESPGPGGRGGGGGRGRGAAPATPAAAGPSSAPAAPLASGNPPSPAPTGAGAQPAAPVTPPAAAYPRGYKVEVSLDGNAWTPVSEGKGERQSTFITFEPVQAKFVRITQTATVEGAPNWSIQRLRLYQVGDTR